MQIEIVDRRDGPLAIVRTSNSDLPTLYYRVDADGQFIEVEGLPDSEDEAEEMDTEDEAEEMDTSDDAEDDDDDDEDLHDQAGEGGGGGGGGYTIDRISQRIIRKFQVTGSEYRLTLDEMSNMSYRDAIQTLHRTLTGK